MTHVNSKGAREMRKWLLFANPHLSLLWDVTAKRFAR